MSSNLVFQLGCFSLVGVAGVQHFGWVTGLALVAAIYLVMPWQTR